ncbi:unnamed protein product [Pleuronectes platessa]|uniref:Uncharacterized protein n=1 Tax=Pleuronectes platessa TaxID=8262 RepID=A0A9N7VPW3_PLEPL|nr:unnamed protein product [Pleuronectes platessa]
MACWKRQCSRDSVTAESSLFASVDLDGSQKSRRGRKGGGGEGMEGGGSPRQSVPYLRSPCLLGERARGRRVHGASMGDVVLGYPRPGLHGREAGRGEDCRYRHATRASSRSRGIGDRDQKKRRRV